jgi:uncharacterized membrane protein
MRLYLSNSMWVFPAFSIVAGLALVRGLSKFERSMGWQINISPETGRVVTTTVAASMLTLVVVVCSALLVAVQLASAQLTPRVIALVYQSKARKFELSLFVFTFTFSVGVLARIEGSVPLLTGSLAAYGFLVNLALFIHFIDQIGKSLRPSSALNSVGLRGRKVIRAVYPRLLDKRNSERPRPAPPLHGEPRRVVTTAQHGAILDFDLKGLVSLAERSDCLIEMEPQVGDFVAEGDPLFRLFEGGDDLSEDELRDSVAVSQERTMDQDPMFAFRIIVDIAIKGLSAAINDPTTAVLAIDQIHYLLRDVGNRHLAEGRETGANGRLRLAYRTPNWEDFVSLAVTEIRHYGAGSIQITRRLLAMLENLIESLPQHRHAALERELSLLHRTVERSFIEPEDRLNAGIGDLQGVGGRPEESDDLQ